MGSGLLVLKNMKRTCYSFKKYYFTKIYLANNFGRKSSKFNFFRYLFFLSSRCEISDRAAAALANGLTKDLGVISEGNTVELLDPKKIHWEKTQKRRTCARTVNECEPN
jgi:hypothetical protein